MELNILLDTIFFLGFLQTFIFVHLAYFEGVTHDSELTVLIVCMI